MSSVFYYSKHLLSSYKILNVKCKSFAYPIVLHFAFFILHVTFLSAQTPAIDSLNTILQTATHDTTRAATLVALTEELYISNPDTVIPLCRQALAIIEKHVPGGSEGAHANKQEKDSYLITKAAALNNIGTIYNYQGQIKEALEYYGRSLKIIEDIGDKKGIATSLNNIAVIYNNQGQIKEALEYYGRGLKIEEDIGNKQGIAISLNNIGYIYDNQGQIKEALEYHGRSLKIREDIGDKQGIANSLNNIGYIYNNQGQIKEALEYHGRSLKIREDIGDKQGIAYSLNNIGTIYNNQGLIKEVNPVERDSLFNRALEYYDRSLKIREDIGDKQGIATSLHNIGAIYLKEKRLAKAQEYADSSLQVARELGYPANIRNAAKLYADVYKAGGNYKAGWDMYELYVVMRDSVKNKENEKTAIRQHTRFEFEKAMIVKEQEEEERSRQEAEAVSRRNMLQYSGILLTLVFLFLSIFLLARRFRKIKEDVIASEAKQTPDKNKLYRLLQSFLLRNDVKIVEITLFGSFLLFFEFILVLLDPYIEQLTGGAPAYKLFVNGVLATAIFPLHKILEAMLRATVIKTERGKWMGESRKPEENSGSTTLLLIVGFTFISLFNISSSDKLDSLNTALNTATHDTTRAATLVALTEELAASNPDTVIPLCRQALAIIEKHIPIGSEGTHANKQEKDSYLITKAAALNNIGYIYEHKGLIKEALEYYGRSLKIYEDIGDKQGIASSLNNIGVIYNNQGQIKEALEYFGRSLKVQEDIEDQKGIAHSLNNIGYIYENQGKIKEALEYYGRSLKIREDIGDKQGIATSLNNIGSIYMNQGQIKEALEYHGRSLEMREGIGDKQGISASMNNIGVIYNDQGQIKEALEYHGRSLKIKEGIGDKQGIAISINNIGAIYKNQGQIKEALEYYGRGLKIHEDIGDKQGIAISLNNIGAIYENQGQIKEALEYYGRSLKILEDIGDKKGIATSLGNIGSIYKNQGQIKEALEYYGRSLKIRENIGDKKGIANSLNNIGSIYLKEKCLAKAQEYADSSLKVARELGYPAEIRNAAKLYADIYKAGGDYKDGWDMYEIYVVMRDSVKNKENEKAAIRQHTQFEFEKAMIVKEQQEEEIKRVEAEAVSRRNTLQYSSIFLALIFLFGMVFFLTGISMPEWLIELSTFAPFMILFEFTLVLIDPLIENFTEGEPLYKLLINALCAAIIFPMHSYFEKKLKKRIYEIKQKKEKRFKEEFQRQAEKFE